MGKAGAFDEASKARWKDAQRTGETFEKQEHMTAPNPQNPRAKKRKHTRARSAEAAQRGWHEQGAHEKEERRGLGGWC